MVNTKQIIDRLKSFDPQKIILFGSYAKGKPTKESDIDLLIIKQTNKSPSERLEDVLKLIWGSKPHIEPQVLTPKEFENAIRENRFFITQEVLKYGKVIYEKKA